MNKKNEIFPWKHIFVITESCAFDAKSLKSYYFLKKKQRNRKMSFIRYAFF